MRIRVLIENTTDSDLVCEHGLSLLIEYKEKKHFLSPISLWSFISLVLSPPHQAFHTKATLHLSFPVQANPRHRFMPLFRLSAAGPGFSSEFLPPSLKAKCH